jgi:hypothetical protein
MREILNLGTYKQLELVHIQEPSHDYIDVNALDLLIRHCPLLKRIEVVGRRSFFHGDVFGKLKRQILLKNFDIKFKE